MDKKRVLILVIVFVVVLLVTIGIIKLIKNSKTKSVSGDVIATSVSDEERVLEESRVIIQNTPDFMDRSGFELVKSDDLQGVEYGKIYSQSVSKAQIDIKYNGKEYTLFLSKSPLFSGDESETEGILIADIEARYLLGADGISHYYYQKGNMYYELCADEKGDYSEIESLIKGFDTKIGDNY